MQSSLWLPVPQVAAQPAERERQVEPVAAVLLFEELTLGGLVRLLLAPRPEARKDPEPKNRKGDGTCLH